MALIDMKFGDCLKVMDDIPDKSIDMILCDLPYGTTNCAWDSPIDLQKLWGQYKRVLKPCRAIVMFASQPFTSKLGASNIEWLKYSWVWEKNRSTGHVHSKNKPMKKHEDILVFSGGNTLHMGQSENRMPYFPQGLIKIGDGTRMRIRNDAGDDSVMGKRTSHHETSYEYTNYPSTILKYDIEMNQRRYHEAQKPVELCKYLIRTYTNEGETVLDNCMGSGTTGIACLETNRNFIGIEKDPMIFEVSKKRLAADAGKGV